MAWSLSSQRTGGSAGYGKPGSKSEQATSVTDLPDNPIELLDRLEGDLTRLQRDERRLEVRQSALQEEVTRYTERDQGLVALSGTLRAHEDAFERLPALEGAVAARQEELYGITVRLDHLFADLFESSSTRQEGLTALEGLSLDDLDEAVMMASKAGEAPDAVDLHATAEGSAQTGVPAGTAAGSLPLGSLLPALVAMVLGVILLIVASSSEGVVLAAFGGALLLFAMGSLALAWDRKRECPPQTTRQP